VWLRDETFFFKNGHLITNRCWRNAKGILLSYHLGPDRLLRFDVFVDDGAKDLEPAVCGHMANFTFIKLSEHFLNNSVGN
jgi:hypothetical protein